MYSIPIFFFDFGMTFTAGFGNIEIYNARMGHWQSESYAVKIIRRIYMFVADVVCSGTFGAICLAPSITVVAKKK